MKTLRNSLFFLLLTTSYLFAQIQVSDFKYSETDSITLSLDLKYTYGNKNVIFINREQQTSVWEGPNNSLTQVFLNKVDKKSGILSDVKYKIISDIIANKDGTLNLLVVGSNGVIYNLKTTDNNHYKIVETIEPIGLTGSNSVNMPKYFQGDILYFSDRGLYRQHKGKAEFICEASEGGFEKYITDNENYAFIARHGYVIFNGSTFKNAPNLWSGTPNYFFKDGRLLVNHEELYEIKKLSDGFDFIKISDKINLDKSNLQDYILYRTTSVEENLIKYLYELKGDDLAIKDSCIFKPKQILDSEEFTLEVKNVYVRYSYTGGYETRMGVYPKNHSPFTINLQTYAPFLESKIIKQVNQRVLIQSTTIKGEKKYAYFDLQDSTKSQILSLANIIDENTLLLKSGSDHKFINLETLRFDPIENPQLKISVDNYPSRLDIDHYSHNKLGITGLSNVLNTDDYEQPSRYSYERIISLDKQEQEKSGILNYKVFYNNDSIAKEVVQIDNNKMFIKDKALKKEIIITIPHEMNKENHGYSVLFPNDHLMLIDTKSAIFCYDFELAKLELLYDNYQLSIDSYNNNILIIDGQYYDGRKVKYSFFTNTTRIAEKRTKLFGKYRGGFKALSQSLIAFYGDKDDILCTIDNNGDINEISPFWKDFIISFCRNGDELLVVGSNEEGDILYSNKYYPVKVPFWLNTFSNFSTSESFYFTPHLNDYYLLMKFDFKTRKFYQLDENIVGLKREMDLSFAVKRQDKLLISYYDKSKFIQYSTPPFYSSYDYTRIATGTYKGVYAVGSFEEKNPQVYQLDTSDIALKWKLFGNDLPSESIEESFSIKVYPNPTAGLLNISSPTGIDKIEVIDLNGRVVLEAQDTTQLNISNISNGIYVLRIWSGIKHEYKRIIKF